MPDTRIRDHEVLITGGAGFIGSHLAEALAETNDVTVLDDLSSGEIDNVPSSARFVEGSVRDEALVRNLVTGVDLVFHQAAVVSVDASIENPARCHSINVDGSLSVLEAARRDGAKVVLASSAAIYGRPKSVPIPETEPKAPTSPYGLDKLATDRYAQLYDSLYDLETVALRYFNVYGPRQGSGDYSGVISVFMDQARTGEPITVHGDGSQTRDFVHVRDVVEANLLAATADVSGEAFNIGTGRSVSVSELATAVKALRRTSSDIVHLDARPGDIQQSRADISKAQSRLGYTPTVDLEAGLETLQGS